MHTIVYEISWKVRRGRAFPLRAKRPFKSWAKALCAERGWVLLDLHIDGAGVVAAVQADAVTPARSVWFALTRKTAGRLRDGYPELKTLPSVWTMRYQARTLTPQEAPDAPQED